MSYSISLIFNKRKHMALHNYCSDIVIYSLDQIDNSLKIDTIRDHMAIGVPVGTALDLPSNRKSCEFLCLSLVEKNFLNVSGPLVQNGQLEPD